MNEKHCSVRATKMVSAFSIALIFASSFLTGCGSDSPSGVETPDSFTVTYNSNGATGGTVPATQTKSLDVDIILDSNVTDSTDSALCKTDFIFVGWNTKADGTGTSYMPGSTYDINSSIMLYAQWKEILKFVVSYNANGATDGTAPIAQTKIENVPLVLDSNSGNLVKTGYTFAGWNTDSLGTGITYAEGATDTINDTLTLYAKWVLTPVQLWNITEKTVLAYETKEVSVDLKPFINVAFSQKAEIFSDIGSVTDSIWKWTPPLGSDSLKTAAIFGTSDSNLYKLSLIITVGKDSLLDTANISTDTVKPAIVKTAGPENGSRITDGKIQFSFTVTDSSGVDSVYWTLNGTSKGSLSQKDSIYTIFDSLTVYDTNTIKVIAVDKSLNKNRDSVTFVYVYNTKITDIVLTSPDKNITDVDTVNIAFTWTGGTDADSDSVAYELRYGTDSTESGLTEKITVMNIQSCKLPPEAKLRPYTNYYWQVAAISKGVYSDTVKSPVYRFKTLISVGAKIFDLNDGEWGWTTRIENSIATVAAGETAIFIGNLTEDNLRNIGAAIKNRTENIALDLSECKGLVALPKEVFDGCSSLTSITLPTSVISIGANAFSGCVGLTSITIPSSVAIIAESVFYGCIGLTEITIPSSVRSIEQGAFSDCSDLTKVTISDGVMVIAASAFLRCIGLTEITIPSSVRSIERGAFSDCSDLTKVTISDGVMVIAEYAFSGCIGLTEVTIPSSVTSIGQGAFAYCRDLTEVTIPSSVKSIGQLAFGSCSSLVKVTIPSSVKSIGQLAFVDCHDLKEVTIPSSVTSIEYGTFLRCFSLTSITIPSNVRSIGDAAFATCRGLTEVTIPSSVTSIGGSAFGECSGLAEVTISDGVTSIGGSAFWGCSGLTSITIPSSVTSIGGSAFSSCSSLTEITVNAANENYKDIDGILFSKDGKTLVSYPAGKKETLYEIPSSVSSIGGRAFSGCSGLAEVTISDGVTSIGGSAFSGCSGLAEVTISDGVTSIGWGAFSGCSKLSTVNYTGSEDEWNAITIDKYNDELEAANIIYDEP